MNKSHFAATCKWLLDSSLRDAVDCSKPPTPEENTVYWNAHLKNSDEINFAILDETGTHVGNCGLRGIDRNRKKAELWIYLGEKRGKGIGGPAVQTLLETGFKKLKLDRIFVRVLEPNKLARNFFKLLSFKEEGRFRHDTIQNKKSVNSVFFSMLSSEYLP